MRPVAIFRFSSTEGPGHFAEWLDARGLPWRLIALDRGERVPAEPRLFSGMAAMGGPMSANDELPWSAPMQELMRAAVAADVPFIGHCLGGQLFAKALGAQVTRSALPEIGWGKVNVTNPTTANVWFANRPTFTTFQWHYDVFSLPSGATRVLTNNFNPNQAYVIGKHIGLQCHIEMTRHMIETWCRSGAAQLAEPSGPAIQNGAAIMADVDTRLAELSRVADDLYTHWARGLVR